MQGRIPRIAGFSLSELAKILFAFNILIVTAAVLFPLFAKPRECNYHRSCLSNVKQVSLAMLLYAQDNDERFPPARSFEKAENGRVFRVNWGMDYKFEKNGSSRVIRGLLTPYLGSIDPFRCPDVNKQLPRPLFQKAPPPPQNETYMYNDLAATEKMDALTGPVNTILIAEGEDMERNVGHSWEKDLPPQQAAFDAWGKCRPERGATVQNAPTRHHGRANYAYADGHCKSLLPDEIFFPPRLSADISHDGDAPGPDPAGKMRHEGRHYRATFHLR